MKYDLSIIMKVALALYHDKETFYTLSFCLSQSWAAYKLRERMKSGEVVEFCFNNADNEIRPATGSIDVNKSQGKSHSLKVLTYFDHQRNAIRLCRIDRLF